MLQAVNQEVIDAALERVSGIDLSRINQTLADPNEGPGWDEEKRSEVETRYRAMLAGKLVCPEVVMAPDKEVDVFWHTHILDTRAYVEDCDTLFGKYLHHDPYLGTEGEASVAALAEAWTATQMLYEKMGIKAKALAGAAFCGMGDGDTAAFCGMGDGDTAAFCGMGDGDTAAFCGMGDTTPQLAHA